MKIYRPKGNTTNLYLGKEVEFIENINDFINDLKVKIANILLFRQGDYFRIDFDNPHTYMEATNESCQLQMNETIFKYKHTDEEKLLELAVNEYYGDENFLIVFGNMYVVVINDTSNGIDLDDITEDFYKYLEERIDICNIKNDISNLSDEELAEKYTYSIGDENLFVW